MGNKDCNIAFKEWSVIVRALLDGRQTLILRKGGISEESGRFFIKSRDFFLYPTKVHQDPADLVQMQDRQLIEAAEGQIFPDHVLLTAFVRVEHYERLTDLDRVKALRNYHAWSDGLIEQRFHYGNEDWLDLFVLRVFRLPAPRELPNDPKFAGCKSWIQLDAPLSIEGIMPVLSDKVFSQQFAAITGILQRFHRAKAVTGR